MDPTSPGLSMLYQTFAVLCKPGAVYKGYVRAGRHVGSPESAVTSGEVQNGIYKAMVGVSPGSFIVLKYHTI